MAAISARCLRSFAKAASMSKTAVSVSGMAKSRTLSSLLSRSVPLLKDSGLLQRIARDNMAKNLAKRHTRLSAAVSVLASSPPILIVSSDSESDGVEGLLLDDDETFSCLDDDAIHVL